MHSLVTAVRASVMSSRPWSSQSERVSAATGSSTETHKEKNPSTPHDRDSFHKSRIDFETYVFIKASSKSQQSLKTIGRHKCNVACDFKFSIVMFERDEKRKNEVDIHVFIQIHFNIVS